MKQRIWDGEEFERHARIAAGFALEALCCDGAHHKQWYLEQIAKELGVDLKSMAESGEYEWEPGIAP